MFWFKSHSNRFVAATILVLACSTPNLQASGYEIRGEAGMTLNAGQNDFAPYYFSALQFGTLSQSKNALFNIGAFHAVDSTRRFSHGWGVEAYAGASSSAPYMKWVQEDGGHWTQHKLHPSNLWLQQLYGEIKYRRIFLQVGLKPHASKMLNNKLTSGDLVWSGNTRPMPEVRAGFIDYVDIPLTKKWVQIEGVISYNWLNADKDWNLEQYNHYNQLVAYGRKMCFKRISFRTNPTKPFHVVASAQNVSTFGGTTLFYYEGNKSNKEYNNSSSFKDYLEALIPIPHGGAGDEYYHGDNKGSWNFQANYRFRNADELAAYFEWFWEDGSGMAKRNGWDGLWGVEYRFKNCKWIEGTLVEYIDLTNQSGPMTWYQPDTPNSTLSSGTTGADQYYNNAFVGPYTYYGHTIGTPAVIGSVFQLDGSAMLNLTKVRGIHLAANGHLTEDLDWLIKFGYRKAYGSAGSVYLLHPLHAWSAMAQCVWHPKKVEGLSVKAQVGFDRGNLPQNTFGALIGVSFDRTFFKSHK